MSFIRWSNFYMRNSPQNLLKFYWNSWKIQQARMKGKYPKHSRNKNGFKNGADIIFPHFSEPTWCKHAQILKTQHYNSTEAQCSNKTDQQWTQYSSKWHLLSPVLRKSKNLYTNLLLLTWVTITMKLEDAFMGIVGFKCRMVRRRWWNSLKKVIEPKEGLSNAW